MALSGIDVRSAAHVRAWYHLLAHFDLGADPMSCVNPAWVRLTAEQRPSSTVTPGRAFGRFHACYRKAAGRRALFALGTAFADEALFTKAANALAASKPAPSDVPPQVKRVVAPLADVAGAKLLGLTLELVAAERKGFLDAWFQRLAAPAPGLGSFLNARLAPLVPVLYGDADQRLVVFPVEALATRSYHVTPARGIHHVALPATLHNAFFHALYAMVRNRTDRLIRPFIPDAIRAAPDHPMNEQIRADCALTTSYHLLMRRAPDEAAPFRSWARVQFSFGQRQPQAAVEALHPMTLLPSEAVAAVRALLGDAPSDK